MTKRDSSAIVIGLTGGIGSGKTAVSNYLQGRGYPIIDSDLIAREVVQPNSMGLQRIVEQFGSEILQADHSLNRAKLRDIIFNDSDKKQQLESILHPLIQEQTRQHIQHYRSQNEKLIFVAIPLLIEITLKQGKPKYIDQIWVVESNQETQIQRATQRDQASQEEIQRIINQQASAKQRQAFADERIDNNSSLELLYQQVDKLLDKHTTSSPSP